MMQMHWSEYSSETRAINLLRHKMFLCGIILPRRYNCLHFAVIVKSLPRKNSHIFLITKQVKEKTAVHHFSIVKYIFRVEIKQAFSGSERVFPLSSSQYFDCAGATIFAVMVAC
jgi:hypothetical protein